MSGKNFYLIAGLIEQENAQSRESGYAQRCDTCLGAARNHDVGFTVLDSPERLSDGRREAALFL